MAFLYAFATGPVFFLVLQMAFEGRGKEAFLLDIGCVIADIVILSLAYVGLHSYLQEISIQQEAYLIGGLVFVLFGCYQFFKKQKFNINQSMEAKTVLKAILKGFLLNIFNISGISYWITLVVLFYQKQNSQLTNFIYFFGTILLFYLMISLLKITLASKYKNVLRAQWLAHFNTFVGILLIAVGIIIMLKPILL